MINIVIPLAGKSGFFDGPEYKYPDVLNEVLGKTMIELVVENFNQINDDKRYVFIINKEESDKYHIDNILKLITDNNCEIVKLSNKTKGAVCSCLMAIDFINNNDDLIIANGNQIIEEDFNKILEDFKKRSLDSGIICFDSVHPKWSYARLDEKDNVVETTEKNPISKNAIAGFYYFKRGKEFVEASMKLIEKDANFEGKYYIAPTINELVLENMKIGIYRIQPNQYNSFYSPQKIKEYERKFNKGDLNEEK